MKKILLLTVATLLTTMIFSQNTSAVTDQAKPEAKKTSAIEWEKKVKNDLHLTADQITKWEAINKEYQPKITAIMNDDKLSEEARKQQKKELKKEKEALFIQLLTPEQQTRYKLMLENKKKEAENSKQSG